MTSRSIRNPAYIEIADDMRKEILKGAFNPGDMLPSEKTICDTYGVSRDTARKSFVILENEGLIASKPKVGYFVENPNHGNYSLTFFEEIPGCSVEYKDIHGIRPDEDVQAALKIGSDRKVIEFSSLILDKNETPIAYDVKYIPYDRSRPSVEKELNYAVFPELTFQNVAPYSYYTKLEITVDVATSSISEILQCKKSEPLLVAKRTFIDKSDNRLGYSIRYYRHPYNGFTAVSGYVSK